MMVEMTVFPAQTRVGGWVCPLIRVKARLFSAGAINGNPVARARDALHVILVATAALSFWDS